MPPTRHTRANSNPEGTNSTNNNNGNQNVNTCTVDPAVAQLIQILAQQTVHFTRQQQHQENPRVTLKTFQAVHPPEFKGSADRVVAQTWLMEMEKCFELVPANVEQKTKFASHYLKNEATYWWESVKNMEGTVEITWERFEELFLEKYFPRFLQVQMELNFLELKQGNMSVVEYENKFAELARFVPTYVETDRQKAKRFQQGLKPWIRSKLAILQLDTYAAVVEKAMIAETENESFQKSKENKKRKPENREGPSHLGRFQNQKKGKFQPGRNPNFKKQILGSSGHGSRFVIGSQANQQRPSIAECQICGKRHGGVCNKLNVVCFKCNQKGHYSRECQNQPVIRDQAIRGSTSKAPAIGYACFKYGKQGHIARDCKTSAPVSNALRIMGTIPEVNEPPRVRVFNMSENDAIQDANVVTGTLNVNSLNAKVLIDSGTTRSFISQAFVDKLNCLVELLNEATNVANQDRILVD
ncbi:uncharacterized protein LOC135150191 [Daucus carota subsp. sativus]|uniref:uncharacterized protein LOC135150191 n=1 Tax=Daucus carota subsp. sativus TaxID=79200 RepID=UPI003083A999